MRQLFEQVLFHKSVKYTFKDSETDISRRCIKKFDWYDKHVKFQIYRVCPAGTIWEKPAIEHTSSAFYTSDGMGLQNTCSEEKNISCVTFSKFLLSMTFQIKCDETHTSVSAYVNSYIIT